MNFLKRLTNLSLVWLILTSCSSLPFIDIEKSLQDLVSEKSDDLFNPLTVFEINLVPDFQSDLEDMQSATIYQVEISIADTLIDISGHQEVTYTNTETTSLDEIYFRMFPNISGSYMTVQNVKVNGKTVSTSTVYRNTALRFELPAALQPGEIITISMDFDLHVPDTMGGNYGLYVYQDEILALDQFMPIIPVFNDQGWNVEDPPINADMVFTDAAFFEVTVDAPQGLVLAGSGVEISSNENGERRKVTFVGGPQRDFYLAASPRFQSASQQVGDTRITSFFLEEYRESGEQVLTTAVKALRSYNERFGLYPYGELDLISTPMNAGGMEYSNAVALSIQYYGIGNSYNGLPATIFLESAAAHEVAHQWFFAQIMNDQIEQPWLDEGLAQYATYLYYLDSYGESAAQGYVDSWHGRWGRVDRQPIPIGKPAGEYTQAEYSAIIYGRSPLFFTEMEKQMGEQEFRQLLKEYVSEYRWGIVDEAQFEALAEDTCMCELSELFDEWVIGMN